jgi:hypothetical protein
MSICTSRIAFATTALLSISTSLPTGAQPYGTARYDASTGALYVYVTSDIALIGFGSAGLFDYSQGLPRMGSAEAQIADASAFGIFDIAGLPAGIFHLGSVLPTGLSSSVVNFAYTPIGGEPAGAIEAFPAMPLATATYNPVTGELKVGVASGVQALLLMSSGLFQTAANPLLGPLTPSQFDASNLMFFNNDAPLPTGTFNLGAVLPPGLNASQISLATKGNGIAVGIPVTVVPEPVAAALFSLCTAALVAWRRPSAR